MTTLLIVDHQPRQLLDFRTLLDDTPDTKVLYEASHEADAVRKAAEHHPDVILMNVRMPGVDGVETTRRIIDSGSRSRIIILTTFDHDEHAHAALLAGASGFLLDDAHPEELLAGIRAVAAGYAVIPPAPTRRLLDPAARDIPQQPPDPATTTDPLLDSLTAREYQILLAIGQGWTNREIAERLFLAESTVKTHVKRVLAKIGARDRIQAVILTYDLGLVRPNTSR